MVRKNRKVDKSVSFQQKFFTTMKTKCETANTVKFWMVYVLTMQEKALTDSELIKSCLIETIKEMYLEKINLFKTISFSDETVA